MDSTKTSLLTLLPTYDTATLPSQLVDLATSLYAQSRSRAANLKQDEEVARGFAVAEIACNRLRNRLNLPKPQSRPPCAPKVYKKLYQYLDNALPAQQARKTDDSPRKTGVSDRQTSKSQKPVETPQAPRHAYKNGNSAVQTPVSGSVRKRKAPEAEEIPLERQLDSKIKSTARLLCESSIVTESDDTWHVFVGAKTILRQQATGEGSEANHTPRKSENSNKESADDWEINKTIVAVFAMVCAHATGLEMPDVNILNDAFNLLAESKLADRRRRRTFISETESLLKDNIEQWQSMEWFQNVLAQVVDVHIADGDEEGAILDNGEVEADQAYAPALYGLGTMRQAKTDWLSEDKKLDYARWKASILAKIEQVESQQSGQTVH